VYKENAMCVHSTQPIHVFLYAYLPVLRGSVLCLVGHTFNSRDV